MNKGVGKSYPWPRAMTKRVYQDRLGRPQVTGQLEPPNSDALRIWLTDSLLLGRTPPGAREHLGRKVLVPTQTDSGPVRQSRAA